MDDNSNSKFCNLCGNEIHKPTYESKLPQSLTSLCEIYPAPTIVWFCNKCGHMMGNEMISGDHYYAHEYKILLNHEDEDQIYDVVGEDIVYRVDHQLKILTQKIKFKQNMLVLDYGCAKAAMSKKLKHIYSDLDVHLFDVSEMYIEHWEKFANIENWAVHNTPVSWCSKFDLICSYFAFEHIPNPIEAIKNVAELLKDDGVFYAIVPNAFTNPSDFIVVDHVNHFTVESIIHLLRTGGFVEIDLDDSAHRGAFVITAKKCGTSSNFGNLVETQTKVLELASYWDNMASAIEVIEAKSGLPVAIYGSGFYGAYIYANLKEPSRVICFLDQSPYQQKKTLFGVKILSPKNMPINVKSLYVGLNPKIAQEVIETNASLRKNLIEIFYLV
jgi:SAM-dependent methyltransferase